MKRIDKKFKKGAASFYVVAFSTLLLMVVVASFATLTISEINRSSAMDLSQSAYDSALAGIEDAKLAVMTYRNNCGDDRAGVVGGTDLTCEDIEELISNNSCDTVGKILGRVDGDGGEVIIQESRDVSNDLQQAYTCVKLKTELDDYRATLGVANSAQIVRFGETDVSNAKSIRFSWYTGDESELDFAEGTGKLPFVNADTKDSPVVLLEMIQTAAGSFTLDQFDQAENGRTNRGAIFLVPTDDESVSNVIGKEILVKSNSHVAKNEPQQVYCQKESYNGFACSVSIELPEPIGGGSRSAETFMLMVSLPYTQVATDFAVELCSGSECNAAGDEQRIKITDAQISIDSTGRANDLYRRVEARVDKYGHYTPMTSYAVQLLGGDMDAISLDSIRLVTEEWGI